MKTPTFAAAKEALWQYLGAQGWTLSSSSLKVRHATSPDGSARIWFKPQALYVSEGQKHNLGDARSLWTDVRTAAPSSIVAEALRYRTYVPNRRRRTSRRTVRNGPEKFGRHVVTYKWSRKTRDWAFVIDGKKAGTAKTFKGARMSAKKTSRKR